MPIDVADEFDEFAEPILVRALNGRSPCADSLLTRLSRSFASIAPVLDLASVGRLALISRPPPRAASATEQMFSARYSSGSSGLAPAIFAGTCDELLRDVRSKLSELFRGK